MTIEQIKEMVNGSAYDFLRTNEHLGRKIIFLTLGGSYSYGTNVETSDVDVRGCALNSESDLLGLTSFEQVVNTQTDTTIYAFNKLVSLLLNCNPNTIEMLGCKPEHYFYISDIGREMIANGKCFCPNEQFILLEVMRISSSGAWRMLLREIGCHRQEERNIFSTL